MTAPYAVFAETEQNLWYLEGKVKGKYCVNGTAKRIHCEGCSKRAVVACMDVQLGCAWIVTAGASPEVWNDGTIAS